MGTFLVYIIKSAFCLTLLYLPYTLLLRGEKHHRLSRMALHVLSVAAFLLPLVQEEWFGGAVRSWQTAMPEGTYAVLVERLEQADVLAMPDTGSSEEAVPIWPMVLVGLYLTGVAVSLAVRLWQWVRMHRFVSRGCLWKECREGGITLYCHAVPCRRSVGCTVLSCRKRIWMARPVMRYTSTRKPTCFTDIPTTRCGCLPWKPCNGSTLWSG